MKVVHVLGSDPREGQRVVLDETPDHYYCNAPDGSGKYTVRKSLEGLTYRIVEVEDPKFMGVFNLLWVNREDGCIFLGHPSGEVYYLVATPCNESGKHLSDGSLAFEDGDDIYQIMNPMILGNEVVCGFHKGSGTWALAKK